MKYLITIYQENHEPSGKVVEKILGTKTVAANQVQSNLQFVKDQCSRSKSDGRVYGIVTEITEGDLPRAWKVDPYDSTQTDCGVEVIDKKTGERRYEGDEGPEDFE